jgi:hypothetical protein
MGAAPHCSLLFWRWLTCTACLALYHCLQELYDVLAQRDAAQEAFCSVCGDGHSGGFPA